MGPAELEGSRRLDWGICLTAAASATLVDALALANVHGGLVVDSGVAHAFLDLAGHGQESLLDIGCVLGRCLEEWDAEGIGEFLK